MPTLLAKLISLGTQGQSSAARAGQRGGDVGKTVHGWLCFLVSDEGARCGSPFSKQLMKSPERLRMLCSVKTIYGASSADVQSLYKFLEVKTLYNTRHNLGLNP